MATTTAASSAVYTLYSVIGPSVIDDEIGSSSTSIVVSHIALPNPTIPFLANELIAIFTLTSIGLSPSSIYVYTRLSYSAIVYS